MEKKLINELKEVSLSMFRKNFLGIFHGAISAKTEEDCFIINKRESIFDEMKDNDFIELYSKHDYRWKQASIDANIHANIYKHISNAKYITYAMPPYATAYSLNYTSLYPKDYFGYKTLGEIQIYDPKNFDTWYDRADTEIYQHLKREDTNIMLIKGYGIYACHRDLHTLVKHIALLENSCKILHQSTAYKTGRNFSIS